MNNFLGLYIPNPNTNFVISSIKTINNHIFAITKENEIIVLDNNDNVITKRFILFTTSQKRAKITNVFLIKKVETILENISHMIVSLDENNVVYYWNQVDGRCITKSNIILKVNNHDKQVNSFSLLDHENKMVLFGCFFQSNIKEMEYPFREIKKIFKVKEDKFYLVNTEDETYILEIEDLTLNEENVTTEVGMSCRKLGIRIENVIEWDSNCLAPLNKYEYLFYHLKNRLVVSFVDSVQELTEYATLKIKSKFRIVYHTSFTIDNEEYLFNLTCEIYFFNKLIRELERKHSFLLVFETENLDQLKFNESNNNLICYLPDILISFTINAKIFEIQEKQSDFSLNFHNIFTQKKLFFTNYYSENFKDIRDNLINSIKVNGDFKVTCSTIYANPENDSIYYIFGTDNGKIYIVDIFFKSDLTLTKTLSINCHGGSIDILTIYENKFLISSCSNGDICFTEIYKDKLDFIYSKQTALQERNLLDDLHIFEITPFFTFKNYHKLERIMSVTQLDNFNSFSEESISKNKKNFLCFVTESKILVKNMETFKIVFSLPINDEKIIGIYHINYQSCLLFLLDDFKVIVGNYTTKFIDRTITEIEKVYSLLRVEEKLKIYFDDYKNPILSHEEPIQNLTKNFKEKDHFEKTIKLKRHYYNGLNKRKITLNSTLNKFDSIVIKKIENFILNDVYILIKSQKLDDKRKNISLFNKIYNPTFHYFDNRINDTGVDSQVIEIGSQNNEVIVLNLEDFFFNLEKTAQEKKNKSRSSTNVNENDKTSIKNERINNYDNFISLFRIWNLFLDQDLTVHKNLKIYQPLFEFNFILFGFESSFSLILNEEMEPDGEFNNHHKFFLEYMALPDTKRESLKENKYCNKKLIINRKQSFLVNLKNYKFSSNLSHYMNLSLFGSLIGVLCFDDSNEICKIISIEKSLLRSLAQQKFIKFSNLNIIDKFLYNFMECVTMPNKDIILQEYFIIKYNINEFLNKEHNKLNESKFYNKLDKILTYLEQIYDYIFEKEVFKDFYKLNKTHNIEGHKMNLLDEFELSLLYLIVMFNFQNSNKIDEIKMIKLTQLLVLFVFKFLNTPNTKINITKTLIEILSKSTPILEKIYMENSSNYGKFLIDLYASIKVPIDLDGLFKKYEIDNIVIIKAEDTYNFLKIMMAKNIKNFSKLKINVVMRIMVEELQKTGGTYDYHSYLLELLWILFREKSGKHVQYLPLLIDLIMGTMSQTNKEMRNMCIDNSKRVLGCLLNTYPMISFHQNSQKLAVGGNDGRVYIYDLTTAQRWKSLNAHTGEVSALIFESSGSKILTYSTNDACVKFWNVGVTTFFSLFSVKDGYYKMLNFKKIQKELNLEEKINTIKFQIMPPNTDGKILLIREDKSCEVLKI